MGLSEITFQKTWYNVKENSEIILLDQYGIQVSKYELLCIEEKRLKEEYVIENSEKIALDEFFLKTKRGYYSDIFQLVEELNKQLKLYQSYCTQIPELKYDVIDKTKSLICGETNNKKLFFLILVRR